jgi:hypothetical protein
MRSLGSGGVVLSCDLTNGAERDVDVLADLEW